MKIRHLSIHNFRGIKELDWKIKSDLICLIGPGDSGKSTILKAIEYALYPYHSLNVFDYDFYNCDIKNPIEISITMSDLPEEFWSDTRYGGYLRGIDDNGEIVDEPERDHDSNTALTIRLAVKEDLEPIWTIYNERTEELDETKIISSSDRAMLNMFAVSDYHDSHFSWSYRSPLRKYFGRPQKQSEFLTNFIRRMRSTKLDECEDCKDKPDEEKCPQCMEWGEIRTSLERRFSKYGLSISNLLPKADIKDSNPTGIIALHDDEIPLRLLGRGSKRLASLAIQDTSTDNDSIVLIDEIESGLEPYRLRRLIRNFQGNKANGQVLLTTHSSVAIEEFDADEIFLTRWWRNSAFPPAS
ncbi:MAG: AAA family ATPase [bacterium]|nr:AAA family ATPase [bacterium]